MIFKPMKPLVLALAISTGVAHGGTLTQVANAAWRYDGTWRAAQMNWDADQQLLVQGRAALFPTLDANYTFTDTTRDIDLPGFDTQEFDTNTYTVRAVQPLFRADAWYGYQEAQSLTDAAQFQFEQVRQDFVLRIAQGYFDVLRAWDNLVSGKAEEIAIARQLEQTQERFDVGLVPATDVDEAQATYDLTRVNLIVLEQQFTIARDQLETLTGQRWATLSELREELPVSGPQPEGIDDWIIRAQTRNPMVLAAHHAARAAENTTKRQLGAQLPQVQLFAQYQQVDASTSDPDLAIRGAAADSTSRQFGLEVNLPLFRGGGLNSRRTEAALRADAAGQEYQQAVRDVGQQARAFYRTVEADALRIRAREQAIRSARSALEATVSGYEVGSRNVVDVLNAQRALFAAQRDFANARYDYIINSLTLKASAGELDHMDLVSVNEWLSPDRKVDLHNPDLEKVSAALIPDLE